MYWFSDLVSQDATNQREETGDETADVDEVLILSEEMNTEDEDVEKPPKSGGRKRPAATGPRRAWTAQEDEEIRNLFSNYLSEGKRPKPNQIRKIMKKSKVSGGVIHFRKTDVLKKKLFRMVDKCSRQNK